MSLFESTLLNLCKPKSNLAFHRFAMVAEKERTQRKKDSLESESRSSAYRADAVPTELRCQLAEPEF